MKGQKKDLLRIDIDGINPELQKRNGDVVEVRQE